MSTNNGSADNVLQRWVAALRSGTYRQARGRLRRGNSYCCLGVLCDVQGTRWQGGDFDDSAFTAYDDKGVAASTTLSIAVQDAAGLTGEFVSQLVNMNDTQGKSFGEIAEVVEGYRQGRLFAERERERIVAEKCAEARRNAVNAIHEALGSVS